MLWVIRAREDHLLRLADKLICVLQLVTNGKIDIQKGCFLVFFFALEFKVKRQIPGQESGTASDALHFQNQTGCLLWARVNPLDGETSWKKRRRGGDKKGWNWSISQMFAFTVFLFLHLLLLCFALFFLLNCICCATKLVDVTDGLFCIEPAR